MRVTSRERGNLFRLSLKPVTVPAYWGFGLVFIALGLLAASCGRAVSLTCPDVSDDSPIRCRLQSVRLAATTVASGRLGTTVTRDIVSWGFNATREVFVTIDGREQPLALVAADGDAKDDLARRLNALLAGTGTTVDYREDSRPALWILGIVTSAGGIVILLSIEYISVAVDRADRTVTIRGQSWWRRRSETIPIGRIRGVSAGPSGSRRSAHRGHTSWNVFLRVAGRNQVAVARMPLFTEASANETAALLERAIRRPASQP